MPAWITGSQPGLGLVGGALLGQGKQLLEHRILVLAEGADLGGAELQPGPVLDLGGVAVGGAAGQQGQRQQGKDETT
jgi:hypothetical protein